MALKNCKECGNQVSDKAEKCPNCGINQPKKTSKLALIFAVIVFIYILFEILKPSASKSDSNHEEQPVRNENKAGALLTYSQLEIKKNAKDPDSVEFRNEQVHNNTDSGAVACGQYNAKNSFGSYAGFKGFVAIEKDQTLYIQDGVNSKLFPEKWNKYCAGK